VEDNYVLTPTAADLMWETGVAVVDSLVFWPNNHIDANPRYIHHYDSSLVRHRVECDTILERRYKHEGKQVEEYECECDTFFHWESVAVYAPKIGVYLDSTQWLRLIELIGE